MLYNFGNKILINSQIKINKSDFSKIKNLYKKSLTEVSFSRFNYFLNSRVSKNIPDSKHSILRMKEGNCVAFSYYIQHKLKKLGYKSYIIPSSVPNYIHKQGYLHICHAAVVLPHSKGFILFDLSFYFSEPINIFLNKTKNIKLKNVYSQEYTDLNLYLQKGDTYDISYNDGNCIIPSDTDYIYVDNIFHNNKYYLREIFNPDECITIHTNKEDKRIFYCKITKNIEIELYYAFDLNDPNNQLLKGNTIYNKDIPSILIKDVLFDKEKLKNWLKMFKIKDIREKVKMRNKIKKFLFYYKNNLI